MDEPKGAESGSGNVFLGRTDRFEGVTVRSDKEYCDPTEFAKKLEGEIGMVTVFICIHWDSICRFSGFLEDEREARHLVQSSLGPL